MGNSAGVLHRYLLRAGKCWDSGNLCSLQACIGDFTVGFTVPSFIGPCSLSWLNLSLISLPSNSFSPSLTLQVPYPSLSISTDNLSSGCPQQAPCPCTLVPSVPDALQAPHLISFCAVLIPIPISHLPSLNFPHQSLLCTKVFSEPFSSVPHLSHI